MSSVLADASAFWHRHTPRVSHRGAAEQWRRTITGPPLAPGERLLRRFSNDAYQLVATDRALYQGSGADWLRLAWPDIAIVGWSPAQHMLSLRLWPSNARRQDIRIPGDAALAAFADERVAATRLLVTHAEIEAGVVASVTAVRYPEGDTVRWRVLVDDQDAAADPAFRDASERLIAELRGLAGC